MKKSRMIKILIGIVLVIVSVVVFGKCFIIYAENLKNEKQALLNNIDDNNNKIAEINLLQESLHQTADLFRNSENYNDVEFIGVLSSKWKSLNEDKFNISILNNDYQNRITEINKVLNTKIFMGYFELTAYAEDSITSTGKVPRVNHTIAVDPRVIPYGSKVFIEGYGTYVAEDCGGLIKGNIIDIFLSSEAECQRFGRRHANVYLLKN